MELLTLPKESIVDILLLLSPKSLIKFLSSNRNLKITLLSDSRLSLSYQNIIHTRNTIVTNFLPITLKYLQLIKKLFPESWGFLLKLKNYEYFDNRYGFSIPLKEVIIILSYNKIQSKYGLVGIGTLSRYKLKIKNEKLYTSKEPIYTTWSDIDELKETGVENFDHGRFETITIYLNKVQINLVNDNIFDYIFEE
jgi:hypothetical protein